MLNDKPALLIKITDLEDDEDDHNVMWAIAPDGHIFQVRWTEHEWREPETGAVLVILDAESYLRLLFVGD